MNPNNAARLTTPMSSESPQLYEEHQKFEPLSPESIASPSPEPRLYQYEWATDPYDITNRLAPPEVAIRNHLFAVEFRVSSSDFFRAEVRFYARVYPDYEKAFLLGCERVTANERYRAALFIPQKGVYGIDVQIRPDRSGFHIGLVKHRYLTTVYDESDGMRVPIGTLEYRAVFGDDHRQEEDLEPTTESNSQAPIEGIQSQTNTDVQKTDDIFAQWLRFSPQH